MQTGLRSVREVRRNYSVIGGIDRDSPEQWQPVVGSSISVLSLSRATDKELAESHAVHTAGGEAVP